MLEALGLSPSDLFAGIICGALIAGLVVGLIAIFDCEPGRHDD